MNAQAQIVGPSDSDIMGTISFAIRNIGDEGGREVFLKWARSISGGISLDTLEKACNTIAQRRRENPKSPAPSLADIRSEYMIADYEVKTADTVNYNGAGICPDCQGIGVLYIVEAGSGCGNAAPVEPHQFAPYEYCMQSTIPCPCEAGVRFATKRNKLANPESPQVPNLRTDKAREFRRKHVFRTPWEADAFVRRCRELREEAGPKQVAPPSDFAMMIAKAIPAEVAQKRTETAQGVAKAAPSVHAPVPTPAPVHAPKVEQRKPEPVRHALVEEIPEF